MIPSYQYLQLYDEDKDLGYVEPTKTEAIVPLVLLPNVIFDFTSAMIQFLNLNNTFLGSTTDDANMHLPNFTRICLSYAILEIYQEALRLRLFLFSSIFEASLNLGNFKESQSLHAMGCVNSFWIDFSILKGCYS